MACVCEACRYLRLFIVAVDWQSEGEEARVGWSSW